MPRAREVFIRLSLLAIMGISCFLLLRPVLNLVITGIVIAVAISPVYYMLANAVRGRRTLAAVLCIVLLLTVVLVPPLLLAGTLVDGIRNIAQQLQAGQLNIPPPPPGLDSVPFCGGKLKELWNLCSTNLSGVIGRFAPQIRERIPALVSASVGIGGVLLKFLLAILFAGFLLATSERTVRFADRVFDRIFDDQGPEFEKVVASTIRSVTNGILGVAVIQSLFASLGFWMLGLPGAGLWALMFLVASILQIGVVVLVPAVLYASATYPASHAVLFLSWCIFVGVMDNILKPILLGRGSRVPMGVIFLGAVGGFMTMRLIGLFVGAIMLSVGYKLLIAWLDAGSPNIQRTHTSATKSTAA